MAIPIIDIFAGPGGLGEGFSSLHSNGRAVFDIKLSIEKDKSAHETLRLRSFFRKFPIGKVPELYYKIVEQKSWAKRKALIKKLKDEFPIEWKNAEKEAWHFELPYPEEFDEDGKKKGGYTQNEISVRHAQIDNRIKNALGKGSEFLLIGGPPCQAFSLVGRSRNQGIFDTDHRVHLYKEYLRIIAKHHPAVFVMENVKGLLSSKIEEVKIFDLIKKDLKKPSKLFPAFKSPHYKIYSLTTPPLEKEASTPEYESDSDYLIKSEKYGIPQRRHRVILLGIREDLKHSDNYLNKTEPVTLKSVIDKLPKIRSGISRTFIKYHESETYKDGSSKRVYDRLKDSDILWEDTLRKQIEILKKWGNLPLDTLNQESLIQSNGIGSEFLICNNTIDKKHPLHNWFHDPRMNGVSNHESRSHLTQDLMRYLFASLYTKKTGTFPRLQDYANHHSDLIPDHANADSGKFTDRFRVQLPNLPATTVTSHISKDGHYFIHYDPTQCRSLTVREAARIQTFPDNYLFCGPRTTQFHQVGNAVPPLLANKIAFIVGSIFETNRQKTIFAMNENK